MMALGHFCLRYLMLGSFVALGLSGAIVCGAGGLFTYQFHEYGYPEVDADNVVVSPVLLILLGLLTCPLALYFWWFIDNKYNPPQLIMFTMFLVLLASLEATTGIVALIKHEQLDKMLSANLEYSLKAPRINDDMSTINHTELKINCCDYNETVSDNFVPWTCCDFQRLENTTRLDCEDFYGTQCRHLTINRYSSILMHVFLLALCSVLFQVFVISIILYYARMKKQQKINRRVSVIRKSSVT